MVGDLQNRAAGNPRVSDKVLLSCRFDIPCKQQGSRAELHCEDQRIVVATTQRSGPRLKNLRVSPTQHKSISSLKPATFRALAASDPAQFAGVRVPRRQQELGIRVRRPDLLQSSGVVPVLVRSDDPLDADQA